MTRWQQPQPSRKQQQAAQHAHCLSRCQQGYHALTATFRAGEQVCTTCGLVLYCPECVSMHHLPDTRAARAYPRLCVTHANAEVQV